MEKIAKIPEGLSRRQIVNQEVIAAISRVPRERFVPIEIAERAFEDCALDIGCGQTISQPFIVALMTQAAEIRPGMRVLEVGTGSGYQSAVLAELGAEVFSVEIIPELHATATGRLQELGYESIKTKLGDGSEGWPTNAPYDAILVTAAAPEIPHRLLDQLAPHGHLVIPVEDPEDRQSESLLLYTRSGDVTPQFTKRKLASVRFVPLTGTCRE